MEIENNFKLKIPICPPALPCHAQAVKRTAKLVTDASQKVIKAKTELGTSMIYIPLKIAKVKQ